jgi:hypothetical protein
LIVTIPWREDASSVRSASLRQIHSGSSGNAVNFAFFPVFRVELYPEKLVVHFLHRKDILGDIVVVFAQEIPHFFSSTRVSAE